MSSPRAWPTIRAQDRLGLEIQAQKHGLIYTCAIKSGPFYFQKNKNKAKDVSPTT